MLPKEILLKISLAYLLAMNLANFFLFGRDKQRARRGQWRVRERDLFLLAILGGSIGGWLGMQVFHHKTRHPKFIWGFPLIVFLQACLLYYICR